MLTIPVLTEIAGRRLANESNAQAFLGTINKYGARFGLDRKNRLAALLGTVLIESGWFRYDREIWGPTPQQLKYDPASGSDLSRRLGNTTPGDGKKYGGRDFIQLTGKYNYIKFYEWCKKFGLNPPDFVANPELVVSPEWKGLATIFYWSTHNLNYLSDTKSMKEVTKAVNGGYTHLAEREKAYVRSALVLLDYDASAVREFQREHSLGVDGVAGPNTQRALRDALIKEQPIVAMHGEAGQGTFLASLFKGLK